MNVIFDVMPAQPQIPMAALPFHRWGITEDPAWCEFRRTPQGIHVRFPELADFQVAADGKKVHAIPVPGLDAATLEHLHLNQILPLALSAQGIPVFHASSVALNGAAVAFLGESGRGKSTLATHLVLHGSPLITDDGLILSTTETHPLVMPSHPSVRLWQDSQDALVGTRLPAAAPVAFTNKVRLLAGNLLPLCEQALPLRRAYFLGEGDSQDIAITPLSGAAAALEWIKHSFLLDIGDKKQLTSHFEQIGHLASQSISFRLDYPRRYDRLDDVRAALLRHHPRSGGN